MFQLVQNPYEDHTKVMIFNSLAMPLTLHASIDWSIKHVTVPMGEIGEVYMSS